MTDPMIGFLFVDVAKLDLEAHVPVIASFWETILLGARSYGGGAFAPTPRCTRKAPLRAGHFERWLVLWRATVDELFAGERAELAKAHALRVAARVPRPPGGHGRGRRPSPGHRRAADHAARAAPDCRPAALSAAGVSGRRAARSAARAPSA